MRVHLTLLLFLLISINSITIAQEGLDSARVNSADVISQDLSDSSVTAEMLQEREISQSDYYRILYAILIFILAFIILKYLKQPLERLSDRGTRFSGISDTAHPERDGRPSRCRGRPTRSQAPTTGPDKPY